MAETDPQGGATATAADPAAQRAATRAAILAGAARTTSVPPPDATATPAADAEILEGAATSALAAKAAVEDADPPGMAAVRKAEQNMRRQLANERAEMRAEFERERAVYQRQLEELTGFKTKIEGSRKDSVGLLKALGMTEDEFEAFAFDIYAHSPKGQKDPRFKERAAALRGQHEQHATVEELRSKLEKLEQGMTEKEKAAEQQARAETYMARVTGTVTDATPLAKAALAKNPDKTTAKMFELALQLYQASGESDDVREDPTPEQVLQAYDRWRAAELEELGLDPKAILAPAAAPAPAKAAKAATPAQPGESSPPAAAAAETPPRKKTRAELLEGIRQERAARLANEQRSAT